MRKDRARGSRRAYSWESSRNCRVSAAAPGAASNAATSSWRAARRSSFRRMESFMVCASGVAVPVLVLVQAEERVDLAHQTLTSLVRELPEIGGGGVHQAVGEGVRQELQH